MLPSVPVKHCRPALSIELMENSDKCWTNEGAAQKPIKNISLAKHHKRERSSSPEGNNSYGSRCYHWRSTKSERGCSCVDFYTDFIDVFLLFTHVLPEKKNMWILEHPSTWGSGTNHYRLTIYSKGKYLSIQLLSLSRKKCHFRSYMSDIEGGQRSVMGSNVMVK